MHKRKLRISFKKVGKVYQSARRDYPQKLIKDIKTISRLSKRYSLLDIGCGTGKSTLPFAKSGGKIIGIDISAKMIKEAKKASSSYPNVSYKESSFENADFPKHKFDLIISGTAFHWLKRKSAYKKINRLLKEKGYLAIFWSSNAKKKTKLISQIREVYIRNAVNYPKGFGKIEKILLSEIKKSKLFKDVRFKKYFVIERYTKKQFLSLVSTYSWVIPLDKKKKDNLFRELTSLLSKYKNSLPISREYKLIIARKK